MNVARAYAYVRAYMLAVILWAVLWITALVMMSQPGAASSLGIFGLFITCILFGAGFSVVFYFALRLLPELGQLRPFVIVFLWALIPVVTLLVLRFGEWDEAIAAVFAGTIAGGAFCALTSSAESSVSEDKRP